MKTIQTDYKDSVGTYIKLGDILINKNYTRVVDIILYQYDEYSCIVAHSVKNGLDEYYCLADIIEDTWVIVGRVAPSSLPKGFEYYNKYLNKEQL